MSAHTPGPWEWCERPHGKYLATPDRGHLIVMDFVRSGMNGAQPRFAIWDGERKRMGGVMFNASELVLAEHPDARLIAAAPDLLDTLETIAAQSSGVVGSTARADCMAALAKLAIAKAKGAAK